MATGSSKEKVTAASLLFDSNGFISQSKIEMFLTAALKMLVEIAPHLLLQLGMDSPVAKAPIAQCCGSCETNPGAARATGAQA
ncbi:hypothetical protein SDRG_15093 [Saprolegnia diclina VS20]|uniref:EF-hand domain-containing protein n=1 Tax=Saprolegnia diclina (strain VS20) TaxID=1156394 RepID=T0R4R9_SAPDV|nr:hypothetical protein SDRG_15093 [Saprolegnia diclina VS20]EQC27083.1 hypothetical protein SDRG_15093 [Saprolegnia diclina VS20]|eukprot:XP_008619477.1 hypothetical protein SDRG_15093 [Saprolegnia diclina VS20]